MWVGWQRYSDFPTSHRLTEDFSAVLLIGSGWVEAGKEANAHLYLALKKHCNTHRLLTSSQLKSI